ncbi:MAG: helix-turn-helix domain-containing protein [Halioglobus sp.]
MLTSEFVESYFDAWNRHDPKQVADHLSRGGMYFDIPSQQVIAQEELVSHLRDYFRQDTHCYTLVGEVLAGESTIAFQYQVSPEGDEDSAVSWIGAEFITMEGDSALKIEDYYREPQLIGRVASGPHHSKRYAKSGLSASGLRAVTVRLSEAMNVERVYLDSHLSLPQLAAMLGCSVNHLSQAINEGHGVSFFDFVNRHRVAEATRILAAGDNENASILDVALQVGFNSTSTFYTAFKKATGQTPAHYRRSQEKFSV